MNPAAAIDRPEEIPPDEIIAALWAAGDLRYKLDAHQLEVDALFLEWNDRRANQQYLDEMEASGAELDDVWVEMIGRRFGKTAKWVIRLAMVALQRAGAQLMYGTALQKDIAEIVVPLATMLLSDGPDDLRPRYQRSKQEQHEGLYFPNGSVIKLVGFDMHPDAARGRFSDGIVLSEAGFMKNLDELVRAVLLPQFQRRPWAFMALESSRSKQPDHDFMRVFVPDAKLRNAFVERTIDDNKAISEKEKAKAIRMAGGRESALCGREYYNEDTRDPEGLVVPEFTKANHVRASERPTHAYCITAADPGLTDLFGQVWGYWDFTRAKLVIQASWAQRNASTRKVACINAAMEYHLWGRWPSYRLRDVPLYATGDRVGWVEMLKGEPTALHAAKLHELANLREDDARRSWQVRAPGSLFTYWDGVKFCENPHMRVSDTEARFIADVNSEHGLVFAATRKDDRESQINLVRDWHADGKIEYLPSAGPVIEHVANAMWNDTRKDFARHKLFGHYDCLAALVYMVRNAQGLRNMRPFPPQFTDLQAEQLAVMPWHEKRTSNGVGSLQKAFQQMGRGRR